MCCPECGVQVVQGHRCPCGLKGHIFRETRNEPELEFLAQRSAPVSCAHLDKKRGVLAALLSQATTWREEGIPCIASCTAVGLEFQAPGCWARAERVSRTEAHQAALSSQLHLPGSPARLSPLNVVWRGFQRTRTAEHLGFLWCSLSEQPVGPPVT